VHDIVAWLRTQPGPVILADIGQAVPRPKTLSAWRTMTKVLIDSPLVKLTGSGHTAHAQLAGAQVPALAAAAAHESSPAYVAYAGREFDQYVQRLVANLQARAPLPVLVSNLGHLVPRPAALPKQPTLLLLLRERPRLFAVTGADGKYFVALAAGAAPRPQQPQAQVPALPKPTTAAANESQTSAARADGGSIPRGVEEAKAAPLPINASSASISMRVISGSSSPSIPMRAVSESSFPSIPIPIPIAPVATPAAAPPVAAAHALAQPASAAAALERPEAREQPQACVRISSAPALEAWAEQIHDASRLALKCVRSASGSISHVAVAAMREREASSQATSAPAAAPPDRACAWLMRSAVIDASAVGLDSVCRVLWPLLGSTKLFKLVHASHEEAAALAEGAGVHPVGVLDTQLAAEMLGSGVAATVGQLCEMLELRCAQISAESSGWAAAATAATAAAEATGGSEEAGERERREACMLLGCSSAMLEALAACGGDEAVQTLVCASADRMVAAVRARGERLVCFDRANGHALCSRELLTAQRPSDVVEPSPPAPPEGSIDELLPLRHARHPPATRCARRARRGARVERPTSCDLPPKKVTADLKSRRPQAGLEGQPPSQ
jgi:hypothetical protein